MSTPDTTYVPWFTQLLGYLTLFTLSCLCIAVPDKALTLIVTTWNYLKSEYKRAWRLGWRIHKWE